MKKRLFLHGIDIFRNHSTVDKTVEDAAAILPDAAYTLLPVLDPAGVAA